MANIGQNDYSQQRYTNRWGSTNVALCHTNNSLRDEQIIVMGDDELKLWAFKELNAMGDGEVITLEQFKQTYAEKSDKGRKAGEVFWGVHRAKLELDKREEDKRKADYAEEFNRGTKGMIDLASKKIEHIRAMKIGLEDYIKSPKYKGTKAPKQVLETVSKRLEELEQQEKKDCPF